MARQFEITIGDDVYSGRTASAKNQMEMLHIAARTGLIAMLKDGISDIALASTIMMIGMVDLLALESLCIKNGAFVRAADKVPVAENLFQDDITNYYILIGKTLRENVGNFWQHSTQDESQANQPMQ